MIDRRPIYERGTPAELREWVRRRLDRMVADRVVELTVTGSGSGRPTGITWAAEPVDEPSSLLTWDMITNPRLGTLPESVKGT